MIVDRTDDLDRIHKVLKHPEIWPRIAEDGINIEEYTAPDGPFYIMDENDIGLFVVHPRNNVTYEVHVQVIPDARDQALEFGRLAIQWVWDNTDIIKLVAEIPDIYPDVLKFALKSGFEVEGVNKMSYRRNGVVHNQTYVGLPRGGNGLCKKTYRT